MAQSHSPDPAHRDIIQPVDTGTASTHSLRGAVSGSIALVAHTCQQVISLTSRQFQATPARPTVERTAGCEDSLAPRVSLSASEPDSQPGKVLVVRTDNLHVKSCDVSHENDSCHESSPTHTRLAPADDHTAESSLHGGCDTAA